MGTLLSVVEVLPSAVANTEAIEVLQTVLDRAKNGEILGVAIVAIKPDRSIETDISGGVEVATMLGGASYLAHRLQRQLSGS